MSSYRPTMARDLDALRRRLLDTSRCVDYLFAMAVGLVPVALSWLLGVGWSVSYGEHSYTGYMESHWPLFVVLLPFVLFAFREVMSRLLEPRGATHQYPPVISLMSRAGKAEMTVFWDTVASKHSLLFAAIGALAITAVDMKEVLFYYIEHWLQAGTSEAPREKDWAFFFVTGHVSPASNLLFVFVAYAVQALVFVIGIWLLCMFANHNRYFLRSIYRRRRDLGVAQDTHIVAHLRAADHCFGFGNAYQAFNTQVFCLFVGGILMLASRYPNTDPSVATEVYVDRRLASVASR